MLDDDQNALLLKDETVGCLKNAINKLASDEPLRQRLADKAFRDVAAFTWKNRVREIVEALGPLS